MSKSCIISAEEFERALVSEEFERALVSVALEKLDLNNIDWNSIDLENLYLNIRYTVTGGSNTTVPASQPCPSSAFKGRKRKSKKR